MAAAYFFHLIKNHPFIDGNKRTSVIITLVFLKYNGILLQLPHDELFTLAIETASSKIDKEGITIFFKKYAKNIS